MTPSIFCDVTHLPSCFFQREKLTDARRSIDPDRQFRCCFFAAPVASVDCYLSTAVRVLYMFYCLCVRICILRTLSSPLRDSATLCGKRGGPTLGCSRLFRK